MLGSPTEKNWLMYWERARGLTLRAIGARFGCSAWAVAYAWRKCALYRYERALARESRALSNAGIPIFPSDLARLDDRVRDEFWYLGSGRGGKRQ